MTASKHLHQSITGVLKFCALAAVCICIAAYATGWASFELSLCAITALCGICWILDKTLFMAFRKEEADRQYKEFSLRFADGIAAGDPAVLGQWELNKEKIYERPAWLEYTAGVFILLLLILLVRSFAYEPFRIPSGSMRPTLESGDFVLANRFEYGLRLPVTGQRLTRGSDPKRGDIVIFHYPLNRNTDFIKRIVGLPGDVVRYDGKILSINGKTCRTAPDGTYEERTEHILVSKLREALGEGHDILVDRNANEAPSPMPRFTHPNACQWFATGLECRVPQGHYMVLGDNRDYSLDSRFWGFVPRDLIVGSVHQFFRPSERMVGIVH